MRCRVHGVVLQTGSCSTLAFSIASSRRGLSTNIPRPVTYTLPGGTPASRRWPGSTVSQAALCYTQRRFRSSSSLDPTSSVPKTPGGHNPYRVFDYDPRDLTIMAELTLEVLHKQYKKLAIQRHPDREGGSNEKMMELNTAYGLIKKHHNEVVSAAVEMKTTAAMRATDTARQGFNSDNISREEMVGRSGGIYAERVRQQNLKKARSPKEVERLWGEYKARTDENVRKMCSRFELAVEHGLFFKKVTQVNEITVRERWLRKQFLGQMWQDVHEMRAELLRRGAKSARQAELAEEMVAFATETQKKLQDNLARLASTAMAKQTRLLIRRGFTLVTTTVFVISTVLGTIGFIRRNMLTATFGDALQ